VADLGTFGARLDDRLVEAAEPQALEVKHDLRKLFKLKASHAALTAELVAGRLPPSFATARLNISCHTGFTDLDAATNAAIQSKFSQFLQEVASSIAEQETTAITRLTAEIDTLKTVKAPAALTGLLLLYYCTTHRSLQQCGDRLSLCSGPSSATGSAAPQEAAGPQHHGD
jgi:hypothetical protein